MTPGLFPTRINWCDRSTDVILTGFERHQSNISLKTFLIDTKLLTYLTFVSRVSWVTLTNWFSISDSTFSMITAILFPFTRISGYALIALAPTKNFLLISQIISLNGIMKTKKPQTKNYLVENSFSWIKL